MKTDSKRLAARFFCPRSFNTIAVCFFIATAVVYEPALACGPGSIPVNSRSSKNPMQLKQRIPDLDEESLGASGRYGGRVRRGSKEYNALVRNYNTHIVFKDDEENGDDRLMTERCKERVDRLAEAVKTKWGSLGIKLRVIDAYDVDAGVKKHHGAHSLHHEGRAVDLTTSDRDRNKYPELGRLAVESLFDWVFYPGRGYIHASVKSEKDAEDSNNACFPETAKVRLENGEIKTMNQLNVGDKVESRDSHGRVVYSRVITFLDYKPNSESEFITIETKEPSVEVAITESHLIYQVNTQTRREAVILARDVKLGDFVYVRNGSAFQTLTAGRVTGLKRKKGKGAFAPLTETGNIVVDNVLCSCYAVIPRQSLAHWSFAPLRFADWIFPGIAAQEQTGLHRYAMFLYKVYRGWNYVTSYAWDNS